MNDSIEKPIPPNEDDNIDVLIQKLVESNDYFEKIKGDLISMCNKIGNII